MNKKQLKKYNKNFIKYVKIRSKIYRSRLRSKKN